MTLATALSAPPWPHCAGHGYDLSDADWSPVPCAACQSTGRAAADPPAARALRLAARLRELAALIEVMPETAEAVLRCAAGIFRGL